MKPIRRIVRDGLAFVLAAMCAHSLPARGDLSQLRVSANHRYLQDASGHPFFLVGDCPQNLPLKLTIPELEDYLADCEDKGFNLLWICMDGQRTASPTSKPPQDKRGVFMMTNGWQIGSMNPAYFLTIDAIADKAQAHGIYCMFTPLSECEWSQANIKLNRPDEWFNYGKFLGARYKSRANIVWQFGNDTINEAAQHKIVQGIKDAGDTHLMTVNWRPGHYREGSGWMRKYEHGESWIDLDAWYMNAPIAKGGAPAYWQKVEYERPNPMPSFPTETQYQPPYAKATDLECRMQNYYTALGGGCGGQVYGSGWLADDCDDSACRNLGGRVQAIHFRNLFARREWWTLVPDYRHELISAGYGTLSTNTMDYVGAALNPAGTLGMAYCPKAATITAEISRFSSPVDAQWYDPTDGSFRSVPGSPLSDTGTQVFRTPGANRAGDSDWVLVLEATSKRFGTTTVTPEPVARISAPYPPSTVISGVTFHDSTARTLAPGSDIWPLTWAADGHQYTTFGDGGGFGGTDRDGRVSLGIARVEGGKDSYLGVNIAGGKNAPHPAPFTGKSEGILAIGDTLYLWRNGAGSDRAAFEYVRLYRSVDNGATWQDLGVEFSRRNGDFTGADQGFFGVVFCQFGRGYAGARDQFVYLYAPEIVDRSHWNIQKPGKISLLRVERGRLGDKSAYCFFAGLNAQKQPVWTANLSERQPVWQDAINGTHRIAASYNAPLRRYLLSTMTVDRRGHAAMFDAPEPWGPWSTVLFEQNTNRWGSKVICFTFANKWLSEDGRRFVIVHTKNDSWASIEGEFTVASDQPATSGVPPYPPSPVIAGIDWAPKESIIRQAKDGDNWPVTWADDDALYTTWGDGTGFVPKVEKKLSMGFARVPGTPDKFTGVNIRSEAEQLGQGHAGKKGWGILCVDGVLYLWLGHADNRGATMQLAWSRDHAKTWTFADWKFAEFGLVGFVNFGRDYFGARDEFVYAYSHDDPRADTPADYFVLMRAPKGKLTSREAWEFFVKLDAAGQPIWTRDPGKRGAVFEHPGACLRSAMTYCAPLKRYLWWQQLPQPPGITNDRGDTRFTGGFGIYDAPEPWGPWTTAFFVEKWDVGPGEHGDFPAKWMSADGKTLHLVFSGDDSFSVRTARLTLR